MAVTWKTRTKLKSPEDIDVWSRTGDVVGTSVWSETHVSGSGGGGGGYISQGSGYISSGSVSINSNVKTRQRFFLREENGRETELNDIGFSVRDGHRVRVVYASHVKDGHAWIVNAKNLSTGDEKTEGDTIDGLSNVKKKKSLLSTMILVGVLMVISLWAIQSTIYLFADNLFVVAIILLVGGGLAWRFLRTRFQSHSPKAADIKEALLEKIKIENQAEIKLRVEESHHAA